MKLNEWMNEWNSCIRAYFSFCPYEHLFSLSFFKLFAFTLTLRVQFILKYLQFFFLHSLLFVFGWVSSLKKNVLFFLFFSWFSFFFDDILFCLDAFVNNVLLFFKFIQFYIDTTLRARIYRVFFSFFFTLLFIHVVLLYNFFRRDFFFFSLMPWIFVFMFIYGIFFSVVWSFIAKRVYFKWKIVVINSRIDDSGL